MTVRLRGHHLLCMLTYVGRGYTPAFTANFDAIAVRLSGGEDILLVDGPDDICAPMHGVCGTHCAEDAVVRRDRLAQAAVCEALSLPMRTGERLRLTPAILVRLRDAFTTASGTEGLRRACAGCDWAPLCTDIAAKAYEGARVTMAEPSGCIPMDQAASGVKASARPLMQ